MEKLELKNGEQIEIKDGATENDIQVKVESIDAFKELYNKFTDENLSEINIYNSSDVLCAAYRNKSLAKAEIADVADEETDEVETIVKITLKTLDTKEVRLNNLEETVDTLVLNSLEVK